MSVLIVTSLGDIVVDLFTDRCPLTSKNFLKLCKIKYYNGCLFHTIQKDFTAQTGDPTGTGSGGDSIYKFLYGDQARFFGDEIRLDLKHTKIGTVAMASGGENLNASQFYLTLRDDLDYLDGKHTVFGEIAEGLETLQRINEAYCDEKGRPYKNIRIKHTYILDDPFDDPEQINELIPDASPEGKPKAEVEDDVRLEDDWVPMDEQLGGSQVEEVLRDKAAHSRAIVLESIGDIPDAEMKPPENVLFVCKLNPVTEDEDLNTIFSRFGTVTSAEIIRDFKTGDSLCYAFIEFESKESCEQAYFKMDNALIDDRRIHVDFSQSVAKLWSQYRRKDSKVARGKGCFKCGAPDHFAKDCQGDDTINEPPSKYILKDDSNQRGGGNNSRYDMVFDEDAAKSPQEKSSRDRDREGHIEKQRVENRNSDENREYEKRDRHRHNDRSREYKDYDRDRNRKPSQSSRSHREVEYREEPRNRDKYMEKNGHGDQSRRERDDRDYRKRSTDSDALINERKVEGHRRAKEDNVRKDIRDDSRNKTSGHADGYKGRHEERDYGKRNRENDEGRDHERDARRHRSGGRR